MKFSLIRVVLFMQSLFSIANAKGFGIVHYDFRFSIFSLKSKNSVRRT